MTREAAVSWRRRRTAALIGVVGAALGATSLGAPARADWAPIDPTDPATPPTVTADPLPTVQIDGVGLTQVVIGNTVYVGGAFTTARPAGEPAGSSTVARRNLLAYDIRTGELVASFAPRLNERVLALAVSPDRKRLYAGGYFTRVNGQVARRIVAVNPTTGARVRAFRVGADKPVRALAARGTAVWLGGDFRGVNGRPRMHLARVRASDGRITAWAPRAENGSVTAMAVAPDARSLVIGGRFTSLNGSRANGYGLARVHAGTGRLQAFPANRVVRNAGAYAGITSLVSDGQRVWGSGFVTQQRGGNLEGAFAANWSDGRVSWLEDCHGDTYSVFPTGGVVYVMGHPHTCANIGGFPDTDPRTYQYALAFSRAATGTVAAEPAGSRYASFAGQPAPSLLPWFPSFNTGTATAARQSTWNVTGAGGYLAVAGEFTRVGGIDQQGLVRFATADTTGNPRAVKPIPSDFTPEVVNTAPGEVTVSFPARWDRDNENLTYTFSRKQGANAFAPVGSITRASTFWQRPVVTWRDTGLAPGRYKYEVRASDPGGNTTISTEVFVDVS